jgi:Glycosyl transferase family 2
VAPVVSFVIPVRNDAERLRHCIRTIQANAYPAAKVEVVVADNGSTDSTADAARECGAEVISLPGHRLGALRNTGASRARGEIIAFVDADHELGPAWIDAAVQNLSEGGVGAAGADCFPPAQATWVQRSYDLLRRHPSGRHATDWLGSGNMAVRRDAFQKAGGFDTSLETCEDVDLCRRLRLQGYRLIQDSRMHNVHFGDPSTLGQVFRGELWRGRDNLRVSLRPPRTIRTFISALIPVANLAAMMGLLAAMLIPSPIARVILTASVVVLLGAILLRAARMVAGKALHLLPGALAVSTTYELARALALPARASYGRRRR